MHLHKRRAGPPAGAGAFSEQVDCLHRYGSAYSLNLQRHFVTLGHWYTNTIYKYWRKILDCMPPHYQQSLQPVEVVDYLEEDYLEEESALPIPSGHTTQWRQYDVIMTLLLRRVPTGLLQVLRKNCPQRWKWHHTTSTNRSTAEPAGSAWALCTFSRFGVNKHCVNKGRMEIELFLNSSSAYTYMWDIQCGPALPISWLKWTKGGAFRAILRGFIILLHVSVVL